MAGADDLRAELGADLPPAIAALDDAQLAVLASALHAARVHQAQALAEASDKGLSFLPRLLRGPVKKALF